MATTRKIRAVQQEGNRKVERELQFYNLDALFPLDTVLIQFVLQTSVFGQQVF